MCDPSTRFPVSAHISFMGVAQKVKIEKADKTGIEVQCGGNASVRWGDLSDADLASIVLAARDQDAAAVLHAGLLAAAAGQREIADRACEMLWKLDPDKARDMQRACAPPAAPKPVAKQPPPPDPKQEAREQPAAAMLAPADVVFALDFDRTQAGAYTREMQAREWPGSKWALGPGEGRTQIVEGADAFAARSLSVLYPKGSVGGPNNGGGGWEIAFDRKHRELYCSYMVRFAPGFDFVKGGKLPGLAGGKANTGGKKPDGTDGWSARIMWRPGGKAVQYVYHADQKEQYGDDFPWEAAGRPAVFVPGAWHHVETRVAINTPGKKDGAIQSWFDGQPALDKRDLRFREVDAFAVDCFLFSTFFGGSAPDWAAAKDERVFFDNFVVSTKRAGPPARPARGR